MGTSTPGWQVTIEGRQRTQVYRTDDSGSRIRSEAIVGQLPIEGNLPKAVAQAVLENASRQPMLAGVCVLSRVNRKIGLMAVWVWRNGGYSARRPLFPVGEYWWKTKGKLCLSHQRIRFCHQVGEWSRSRE
jgi:hypothetical protein